MLKLDLEYPFYIFMLSGSSFFSIKKKQQTGNKKGIRNLKSNYLNQNTNPKHLPKQLIANFSLLRDADLSQNPKHSLTSIGRKALHTLQKVWNQKLVYLHLLPWQAAKLQAEEPHGLVPEWIYLALLPALSICHFIQQLW